MRQKQFLQEEFPEFASGNNVVVEAYPTASWLQAVAAVLTVVQWSGIILMLAGQSVFEKLDMPVPAFIQLALDNKMVLLAVFFISGQLASRMTSTGLYSLKAQQVKVRMLTPCACPQVHLKYF